MKLKIVKAPRVDAHLSEHYSRIMQDKVAPAERFLKVAAESFERLAEFPMTGLVFQTSRKYLAGIRSYPLPSPYRSYIVIYRVEGDSLQILGVLHGARHLERAVDEMFD